MSVAALLLGVFSFTQQYAPLAVAESLPGLADGHGRRGPGGRAGHTGLAGARTGPGHPVLRPPSARRCLRHRFAVVLVLSVVALAGLIVRFRLSAGAERQQITWFAYGAMIGIPLGLPAEVPVWGPILELVQPPLMFAGLGIGMFRYRLYDIDRLLNRTLVYGLLTVSLAAAYAVGVLLLGGMVSGGRANRLVVAAVTLAVAVAFQPLRGATQRAVDRRFNRRAYDAAATIEAFAVRLRQQVDADALTAELLAVVDHTIQPTQASLWLRPGGRSADAHS